MTEHDVRGHGVGLIAGVDGCRQGRWVALILNQVSHRLQHHVVTTGDLAVLAEGMEVMAIDIPIGLWDRSTRPCDTQA